MVVRFLVSACAAAGLLAGVSSAALADGDAAAGKKVFNKCKVCHSLAEGENKIGPSLAGVVGLAAGTVEGFKYSDAMKEAAQAGVVWDIETLTKFIAKPRSVVNGSTMGFTGYRNPEDVAAVIAYLAQFSAQPAQ